MTFRLKPEGRDIGGCDGRGCADRGQSGWTNHLSGFVFFMNLYLTKSQTHRSVFI